MVRAPFPMRSLAKVLNFSISANMKKDIEKYKLRQKNIPTEYSFDFQLSTSARGILYAVLFEEINDISELLFDILYIGNFKG